MSKNYNVTFSAINYKCSSYQSRRIGLGSCDSRGDEVKTPWAAATAKWDPSKGQVQVPSSVLDSPESLTVCPEHLDDFRDDLQGSVVPTD